ncbi:Uncharacterised protein [Serratia quinivorans]|uniref:hypothetical protein n=1 Tax=Serratia quinivorans TaxID=137545 RepID=UPI00217CA6BA|nr:hypothetical protein [Serratia quinivorans]CAI0928070.1 Uncharacterised protein [Serratia quinivorans]
MMITTPTREEILQVIEANAEKPSGWKFDPKTTFGRYYMQALELTVGELKEQLFDLLDPEVFYTKWTLRVAAAFVIQERKATNTK